MVAVPSSSDLRREQLCVWLQRLPQASSLDISSLRPASSDASFRRYFRLDNKDGGSLIAMDAPPDKENSAPFVQVAQLFAAAGVSVPAVHRADLEQGFLLLSDLGTRTYLDEIKSNADVLYAEAFAALISIQKASKEDMLPRYDRARLSTELNLFPEWYIARHRNVSLSDTQRNALQRAFDALLANNLAQPAVYVHRDYHSRNLMVLEQGNPGVLDFQDAVMGPITYDLASLLRDAYVEWEEERQIDWAVRYWERARGAGLPVGDDFGAFYRDFEWMGLQRHLKVLGIFARLNYRDGKARYLDDLPLVLKYARTVAARYVAFTPLLRIFDAIE